MTNQAKADGRICISRQLRTGRPGRYSIRVVTGVPSSMVRLTVQSPVVGFLHYVGQDGRGGIALVAVGAQASRSIGQLIQRGPPRPRPSSPPGTAITSMPLSCR